MANANKDKSSRWYFTKEQLESTPSRRCGFDAYKELQYRQQAANFIQDMGQKLQVSQLCISTAIVYMHRFYVFHSFTDFPWHQMAAAALFLAAKVEEQPRKLEYVIRVANHCKNTRERNIDVNSERYIAQSQDLVFNENVLLQTLGFDVAIDHPHTHVVKCCQLVRATKDLAQTSYFMASNSLHLTTMCIQYRPTVVACFCILLACKWSNWEIPLSNEKKEWYTYVDPTVTAELLEQLTSEFLVIFENCPSRLKEKITGKQDNSADQDKKSEGSHRVSDLKGDDLHKHRMGRPIEGGSSGGHRTHEQRERERKEKERIAHMSGLVEPNQQHHHHHHRLSDPSKMKTHTRQNTGATGSQHSSSSTSSSALSSNMSTSSRSDVHFNRDHVQKEMPRKPDPNATSSSNSSSGFPDMRQRVDPNRSRTEQAMSGMRRLDEQKAAYYKHDVDKKQHFGSAAHVKSSSAAAASTSTTSQKKKSPFNMLDNNKSVPRPPSVVNQLPNKQQQFNGSTNGSYAYSSGRPLEPSLPDMHKIKTEPPAQAVKGEIPTPPVIKRPSLFSPEQTPMVKPEPIVKLELFAPLTALSPISSPPSAGNRNYLGNSEPELKPAIKKIEQVEGFENVIRNNTINMANMRSGSSATNQQPQTQDLSEIKQETVSSKVDVTTIQPPVVNGGLETSPIVISNLLKEAVNLPGVVPTTSVKQETITEPAAAASSPSESSREHKHHKNKKKKEKHKHKDKDKSKDEKEKRKKHKDKSKEKHKHKEKKDEAEIEPPTGKRIMLTINKEKLQQCNEFKFKNKKTEASVDPLPMAQPSTGGLKIKIPKEFLNNCNASSSKNSNDAPVSSHSSRKRDRERSPHAADQSSKLYKSSHKDSKQNGRHSYSKVAQGDGETSLRLAESKYTKGSS